MKDARPLTTVVVDLQEPGQLLTIVDMTPAWSSSTNLPIYLRIWTIHIWRCTWLDTFTAQIVCDCEQKHCAKLAIAMVQSPEPPNCNLAHTAALLIVSVADMPQKSTIS